MLGSLDAPDFDSDGTYATLRSNHKIHASILQSIAGAASDLGMACDDFAEGSLVVRRTPARMGLFPSASRGMDCPSSKLIPQAAGPFCDRRNEAPMSMHV